MLNSFRRPLSIALAAALSIGAAVAQDIDLATQRGEDQNVRLVPGQKLAHPDVLLNPTPHSLSLDKSRTLPITKGFALSPKAQQYAPDLWFAALTPKGVTLDIDFGAKVAQKAGVKAESGAYRLTINDKGIAIKAYDDRGAFYALQTLRQLMSSPVAENGSLPYADINDYPDLPIRGVVEGFYGNPWSHAVRLSLIEYYGRHKMNTYLYGPKDDPYHSSPNWRLPYPAAEATKIRELAGKARQNRVDFVWAIHPGQDIKWNEEDYQNLVNKLNMMYDLGVRHFAVFFDDISGEGAHPSRQAELLNRLNREFVKAKGDVGPLTVCPTDYTKLWANPKPTGALAIYGNELDPDINVFWTGDVVCSDMTPQTLDFVNSRIKRPAFYWWNFPVSDYCRNMLLLGPVYGLDTSLTKDQTVGIVSNPMEHGEASKTALYGVADYSWNVGAYNPIDNWERSIDDIVPDSAAADAYRRFAIHSADTETGYRRAESWETKTFRLNNWDDNLAYLLDKEFLAIEQAPATLRKRSDNALLLRELDPWLTEFGKLGTRGRKAIALGNMFRANAADSAIWNFYANALMSDADRKAYEAHKAGTMKLQPFYNNMMRDVSVEYFNRLLGEPSCDYRGLSSYANSGSNLTQLMLDGNTETHYTSAQQQGKPGNWIGVDLMAVRPVSEVNIRQGRNSTDDVDFYDHAALEASADGKNWTVLIPELKDTYDISWKGEPVQARYVRLRRLESERRNYASVRTFEVNPLRADKMGFSLTSNNMRGITRLFDKAIGQFYSLNGNVNFGLTAGAKTCTILAGPLNYPYTVKVLDAKGKVLLTRSVKLPYAQIQLPAKAASVELSGKADIYEVIVK